MRHDKLDAAILAARTFIQEAEEVKAIDKMALRYDPQAAKYVSRGPSETFDSPSKNVAAVKRRSLDLTRALADLRKRGNQ